MTARGWPFLVAAGRRRDYRTLLAPDFLVANADYGVLDEVARPTSGDATTTAVRTRAGRRLTVVYATHLLTAADVGGGGPPRDEHNRPLRLIYGFVVPGVWSAEQTDADLSTALGAALEVYRGFLADEESVAVAAAAGFALRSRLSGSELVGASRSDPSGPASTSPAVSRPSGPVPASRWRPPDPAIAVGTRSPRPRPASARAAGGPVPRVAARRGRWLAVAVIAGLAVAIAVAALVGWPSHEPAPGAPCPTFSATAVPPGAPPPSASPTCVVAPGPPASGRRATVDIPARRPGVPAIPCICRPVRIPDLTTGTESPAEARSS